MIPQIRSAAQVKLAGSLRPQMRENGATAPGFTKVEHQMEQRFGRQNLGRIQAALRRERRQERGRHMPTSPPFVCLIIDFLKVYGTQSAMQLTLSSSPSQRPSPQQEVSGDRVHW